MLLVKTYLDRSPIHGLGVFAAELIPRETKIWRFVEGFDRCYSPAEFARLPKQARDFLKSYAYKVDGEILFTVDHDHYINHSDSPNTYLKSGYTIARRNIRKGEEITNDYREFDASLCAAFLRPPARASGAASPNGSGRPDDRLRRRARNPRPQPQKFGIRP